METYRFIRLGLALAVVFGAANNAGAGTQMNVRDVKGRALGIELISVSGKNVRFKRVDTGKEFTVALDQFDEDSRSQITTEAAKLPPVLPPITADVVIGKRRDKGDSFYLVTQEVSCTVKLHNASVDTPLPKLTGRILFIGRNQRLPDDYTVLSVQDFPVELKPSGDSVTVLEPFVTKYDSDNKGEGNVGGYQYSGYLMVFLNDNKEVVFNQTTDADIRRALAAKPKLLAAMAGYTKGAYLDQNMGIHDQKLRPPTITN